MWRFHFSDMLQWCNFCFAEENSAAATAFELNKCMYNADKEVSEKSSRLYNCFSSYICRSLRHTYCSPIVGWRCNNNLSLCCVTMERTQTRNILGSRSLDGPHNDDNGREVKKVKESRKRFGVSQRVPRGLGSQISWHSAHEGGEVVSLTHRRPLPTRNVPGSHFQ